jgi:hypothetical protein
MFDKHQPSIYYRIIGYQSNFIHKDVDGALSDVLDF